MATKRANDDLSKLEMTKDRKDGQQMLAINQRRSQELSQCEAEADHENEELSARQQAEYERETEEEKAHATMISAHRFAAEVAQANSFARISLIGRKQTDRDMESRQ